MKHNLKNIIAFIFLLLTIFSCKKETNQFYPNGKVVILNSSTNAIAPAPADSLTNIISFSWTNPAYANDSSTTKYTLEFDSSGRNFSHEQTITVTGKRTDTLTAKAINTILLDLGFSYNVTYNVDVRITSSYANNNEQLLSNVLTLKMTPYVVPPKVQPPSSDSLFITGSATAGSWQAGGGSGVPVPAQQFKRLDSVTYQGTFYLNGGQQYLLLPVNGDWSHKYALADNSVNGIKYGGSFGLDFSSNFLAPDTTGLYNIFVDFQHGTFTVTKVQTFGLMYVPGDYQGWTPATAPTLGSPGNDGNYDGYINIPSGGTYQFKLNLTPDWSNSYGDGGGGTLSASGGNIQVAGPGYYHISASTVSNTWSAVATTWSLIGSFAASGWSNDVDMVYDASANNWTATITVAAGDQFKFRANHDWGTNLGESGTTGGLVYNGDNIGDAGKNFAVGAGSHKITLYLNNSGYYTCLIQ